jgi:hypothetical protein
MTILIGMAAVITALAALVLAWFVGRACLTWARRCDPGQSQLPASSSAGKPDSGLISFHCKPESPHVSVGSTSGNSST